MIRPGLGAEATARFQLLGPLGAGGFGEVYEAADLRTGLRVAIKALGHATADGIARFKHEFRALADCHHPNLVALQELIEDDGRWQIVMELVPGTDLIDYVRGHIPADAAVGFDEGRLRGALSGVVEGLRALHGYGILHRDLKPSNVRVRPDGRAVLLDFGLATSVHHRDQSAHSLAVGSVRYMAPEQAAGENVGPPADLYALGVCLFEALTGQRPFDGDQALQILILKQQQAAPLASSRVPDVPPDLDALCAQLLAIDPRARPSTDEVLRVLGGDQGHSLPPNQPHVAEIFAGREAELEQLERALSAVRAGAFHIVLVEGESGVGKSELVAEFVRRAGALHPNLLALRGRCYENEQVSYKAFDGCIDELSRYLQRLPEHESAALLPVRAPLLGQLFPVLRNLRLLNRVTREDFSADPTARRLEAFEALGALLEKLAQERPLALVVDDLQWADAESFRMLQALVERPSPPALLLIATVRPRDELEAHVLPHMDVVRSWPTSELLPLHGLSGEQSKALASKLLGHSSPAPWLEMIAVESAGHPLFLSELVHYTRSRELTAGGTLTLDAALRARIEQLDQRARQLLELVALAARPHGGHVFAHALSLPDIDEPARLLLSSRLLRLRKGQELGCYHDRIRRTASALIAPARAAVLHRQLAFALAAAIEVDPVEQAHHWDLAGDSERAIAAYELAVARAIEALAFNHAAKLSARALALIDDSGDPRAQALIVQRAHALACAGRSQESAQLFQQAAYFAYGPERIRLRSNAAQQLSLSAKTSEGFDAARTLLIEVGVKVPLGVPALLTRFAWDSLCLWLGAKLRRDQTAQRSTLRERPLVIEVVERLVSVVALIHPLMMLTLTTQHLRLARRAGSLLDAGLALSQHGWLLTVRGAFTRALPLFEESRDMLAGAPPTLLASQAHVEGSARVAGFDLAGARSCLERAEELARVHCLDRPWFLVQVRYHLGLARYHLGEHARLARDADLWLAEVRERNDILGEALLFGMGHCFLRHLMRDAPDAVLEEHTRILAALPAEPFSFAHLGLFMSKSFALSYKGGSAGLRWIESFEPQRNRAGIFNTSMGNDLWLTFSTQALLHALAAAEPQERTLLLRRARRSVDKLAGRSALLRAYASLITAQLEAISGRRERALEQAHVARGRFEALGHGLRRNALFLEGLLEGAEGASKQAEAIAAYRGEGWQEPLRCIIASVPTLPLLLAPDKP